ncbi:MAG: DUF1476 domain-containing protein [Alphaproteobacteria bacterium]|nr:DUF1476 domain-containing protein [Alphaproteobacteria bacterium]
MWCIDAETRNVIIARRNVLLGLWAGRLMGKDGEALTAYARELHRADFEVPGDSDIIAKLTADLASSGHPANVATLRQQISKFQRQAWRETASTD